MRVESLQQRRGCVVCTAAAAAPAPCPIVLFFLHSGQRSRGRVSYAQVSQIRYLSTPPSLPTRSAASTHTPVTTHPRSPAPPRPLLAFRRPAVQSTASGQTLRRPRHHHRPSLPPVAPSRRRRSLYFGVHDSGVPVPSLSSLRLQAASSPSQTRRPVSIARPPFGAASVRYRIQWHPATAGQCAITATTFPRNGHFRPLHIAWRPALLRAFCCTRSGAGSLAHCWVKADCMKLLHL